MLEPLAQGGIARFTGVTNQCDRCRLRSIFPRMPRESYIARSIKHWHVVRIGADGRETVVEITDSEKEAKAEAARLDSEAERAYQAEQKPPNRRD
jgi:hypothetical protein